jgi:transposase
MLLAVTPDSFIPDDHPIRRIKPIVESALVRLSPLFNAMYAERGRPSIPPEHLLKASLLIALYSIRSERQFCERLRYDLLFKWFLDLNVSDEPFDASTFSKNRERLLAHDVSGAFFAEVVAEARRRRLLSADHFTVDGTLLEAWASLKSYRPRDEQDPPPGDGRNPDVDFRGQRRSRDTHVSTTDPEARLFKKGAGQAAKLSYMGHLLTENRHGLVLAVELTAASGTAEREAALLMLDRSTAGGVTLGADKGYDTHDFVAQLRSRGVTPHVAQNDTRRRSAVDRRTTRHVGYEQSLRRRKLVEQVYGWMKTVGGGRKLRFVGLERNRHWLEFTAAAYNLVRLAKLELAPL